MLAKTIGIHGGLSNKPKMTSRTAGLHFSEAAMRGNQSHASRGFRGGSKIVISLHCPSTIMRRSAADGNHMPVGLTSPSQSLPKGRDEDERRRQKSGDTKQDRRKEVQGVQREGGTLRGVKLET